MAKKIEDNQMQVYKADLHIHTPASKCYKGFKDDAEYLKILLKAKERGINIIAITDHNSIEGYKKLIEQKERIKNEIDSFKQLQDSNEAKRKIKEDEKILKIFDSILILPGIEFEVNNGVHMLVIFNPETEITTIKDFLKSGGFDDDDFGKGNDVFSNWSLFEFYNKAKNYDCLVFDAHTDSNKGIYDTISEGTTRIHAFTDDALVGICYKNEGVKSKIRNLLLQPKYKRNNPVAFLKSSDAHKVDDIGKDKTFFRLKELLWDEFKNSFNNPDEFIFTSNPNVQTIIKSISDSGRCIFISDLEADNSNKLAESICGLNNSDGGYIIIGADSKDVINGIPLKIKEDNDRINKFIEDALAKVNKKNVHFNAYSLKDDVIILIAKVDSGDEIVDIEKNGIIYYFKKGNNEKLNANQIQQVLSQRIETKYQQQISNELIAIKKSVSAVDTYLKSQPILSEYGKNSLPISDYILSADLQWPTKLTTEQKQKLIDRHREQENGCSRGNTIFIFDKISPRLKDAFLRITPPKFTIQGIKTISNNKYIYVIPGGAVFYSKSELNYHSSRNMPILKIRLLGDYPIKFLCAFLKSSFFLWYIKNKFGDLDFFSPKIFNNITIPILHPKNKQEMDIVEKIETDVDNIIELENNFLKTDWTTINDKNNYIIKHNALTKDFFKRIDESIFSLLRLKEDEILVIKENLHANYIYMPE